MTSYSTDSVFVDGVHVAPCTVCLRASHYMKLKCIKFNKLSADCVTGTTGQGKNFMLTVPADQLQFSKCTVT